MTTDDTVTLTLCDMFTLKRSSAEELICDQARFQLDKSLNVVK